MHITVYLDRLKGTNPALVHTLHELGTWMGQKGHTLIYDSTKTGLTEELVADVLAAGGTVIDIASQFSTDAEPQDSSAHKERIIEVGGAFIARRQRLGGGGHRGRLPYPPDPLHPLQPQRLLRLPHKTASAHGRDGCLHKRAAGRRPLRGNLGGDPADLKRCTSLKNTP